VTVLVDDAIWPWRGRNWAHLVSDSDLDELHDLAHGIGMPYLAFQGDHYDIHDELRQAALDRGAVATPARQLVRALRVAGLRHKAKVAPWRWSGDLPANHDVLAAVLAREGVEDGHASRTFSLAAASLGPSAVARAASRPGERLVIVTSAARHELAVGIDRVDATTALHLSVGERGSFVELSMRDEG
jgi:hypothetical protein